MTDNKHYIEQSDRLWEIFSELPQSIKTKVIAMGLLEVISSNFKGEELRLCLDSLIVK